MEENTDFNFGAMGASVTLSPKKKKKKSCKRDKLMPEGVVVSTPAC